VCADFVVGEAADSFLAQILVLGRLDDERAASVFRSQLLALRSSPHHPSTKQLQSPVEQETQLSPRDRAMRRVS